MEVFGTYAFGSLGPLSIISTSSSLTSDERVTFFTSLLQGVIKVEPPTPVFDVWDIFRFSEGFFEFIRFTNILVWNQNTKTKFYIIHKHKRKLFQKGFKKSQKKTQINMLLGFMYTFFSTIDYSRCRKIREALGT